jgi:hypothetical protein
MGLEGSGDKSMDFLGVRIVQARIERIGYFRSG